MPSSRCTAGDVVLGARLDLGRSSSSTQVAACAYSRGRLLLGDRWRRWASAARVVRSAGRRRGGGRARSAPGWRWRPPDGGGAPRRRSAWRRGAASAARGGGGRAGRRGRRCRRGRAAGRRRRLRAGRRTGRNRSWAVCAELSPACSPLSPGTEMTMLLLPSVTTSASATPRPLTRCSMICRACSSRRRSGALPSGVRAVQRHRRCRPAGPGRAAGCGSRRRRRSARTARRRSGRGRRSSAGRAAGGGAMRGRLAQRFAVGGVGVRPSTMPVSARRRRVAAPGGGVDGRLADLHDRRAGDGDLRRRARSPASTSVSPRPATVPWSPLVVITGVPMVSEPCIACALAGPLALPGGQHEEHARRPGRPG